MRLAKTMAIIAGAGLLTVGIFGSARHVYAQDAAEVDQDAGAWSAPADSSAESSPEAKAKPPILEIAGCWSGDVSDSGDGIGTATFQFDHHSNRKKFVIGTSFDFSWPDTAMARGPLKGKVTSTGITFEGNAGAGCAVSGSGTGNDTQLMGTVTFKGTCASTFQDVTFSITPGCP